MTRRTSVTSASDDGLPAELVAVRDAAEAVLAAHAAGEVDAETQAQATEAAKAALDGGHALTAVAAAEQAGQQAARDRLGAQVLREVERTAKRVREATLDHEASIARAARIGLPDRQVADRAGIAHATVRSIVRRHAQASPDWANGARTRDEAGSPAAPGAAPAAGGDDGSDGDRPRQEGQALSA